MKTLISTVAILVVLLTFLFIAKRIADLLRRRKDSPVQLHEAIADVAEDVAGASKIAATLASAAVFFAAPAGLLAAGAALGLVKKPLIVVLLPALLAFAGGAMTLSAAAKLYAKRQRKRIKAQSSEA